VSPDSELIAVQFKEKALVLVFNPKGQLVAKIEDPQNGMAGMVWAPDSVQLLVFSELLFRVSIYNMADKSVSYIRNPKLPSARGCVFSSAGKLMALLERHDCKDVIGIYHCGDWKMVNSIPLESFDAVELLWSPNDAHLVAWENPINYRLHAVCPFKGVVLRYQPYDFALGLKAVEFSKRGFFLAAGSFDEKVRLLNAVTWKLIVELDCSTTTIAYPEAKIYKEDDSLNRMKLVDRAQYKIPVVKPAPSDKALPAQGVGLLDFSYDDSFLVCRNGTLPFN
jgi:WD40 repeat protein